MRKASSIRYWVFRGQAGSRPVAWGTSSVKAPAGVVSPVLIAPPEPVAVGPALTVGEPPPAVTTSLQLADPDGELAALVLPNKRGLNGLTGRVYFGEITGDSISEKPISPTMHISGNVVHEDGVTTIQMQSDDSHVLGRSISLWSVQEVLGGELLGVDYLSGPILDFLLYSYLEGRPLADLLSDARAFLDQNQGTVVPWVYDPAIVEMIPLNSDYPRFWIGGVQSASVARRFTTVVGDFDGSLRPLKYISRTSPVEFILEMSLVDQLGSARNVAVRMYVQAEQSDTEPSRHLRFMDPAGPLSGVSPPRQLLNIIRDHSPAGLSGVDSISFLETEGQANTVFGRACGGVFGDDGATIREVIQHIAPICGMRVWLGVDDKVYVSMSGYSYEDSHKAKGSLVELQEGDVFPKDTSGSPAWRAEIAGDPTDDAVGAARVSIEWSEDQRRIYPLETSSSVPVLGQGPGDADRERIISGAWIVPARGADVVGAIQAGISSDAARVELSTHLGAHALKPAQLIRVTHPRGLGLPGMGWDRRLARVDQVQVMPGEDATRLLITDLGLSERMRLGLLDAVNEWIVYKPDDPSAILEIEKDGEFEFVIKNLRDWFDGADWGSTAFVVWTPGASEEAHRRSWRILHDDGNGVRVVTAEEGLPSQSYVHPSFSDSIIGVGWAVLRTDLLDPFFRESFIRSADKQSGEFESGRPGFQYSAY